jgi:transposase
MNKKYCVQLSREQRQHLDTIVGSGTLAARTQIHARILLKADVGPSGPAWGDAAIAEALDVSIPTIERVRKAFVTKGLDVALYRRRPRQPPRPRKLDGAQEARVVALTCSTPPQGHERWTLTLLREQVIALEVVDAVARETLRRLLKKTNSSRG